MNLPSIPRDQARHRWLQFLESLNWSRGALDDSSWRAALRGASLGIAPELMFDTIHRLIATAGDCPKAGKIVSQIQRAYAYVDGQQPQVPGHGVTCRPPRQECSFQPAALAKIAAGLDVANVVEFIADRSAFCPTYVSSGGFLARLYQRGEQVVVFTNYESQGQFLWSHDLSPDQLPTSGPDGVWYLVNPVDGHEYPNPRQGGKMSRRSQESVTNFRFVVLESDHAEADAWLRFLALAPLRIAAIYFSGGRSIHALVQIDAKDKEHWDAQVKPMKSHLTVIGADPAALTAVRLSRLPQAWRDGRQQRLLYLNPQADGTPICNLPVRPYHTTMLQFVRASLAAGQKLPVDQAQAALETLRPFAQDPEIAAVMCHLNHITGY